METGLHIPCYLMRTGGTSIMKLKPFVIVSAILFVVTLMIPTLVVLPFSEGKVSGKLGEETAKETVAEAPPTGPAVEVAVYRTASESVETLELDNYVTGVVASEMPATFELEALKAQALTARTYIVRQMISSEKLEVPDGALVTDTVQHQVFKNEEELRKIWGKDYSWKIEKIRKAVQETSGQILTYEGSPIDATFFSTSNGYTENAESVWQGALPYLKSVESPWDLNSKEFNGQKVVSVSDFEQLLGVKVGSGDTIGKVVERTSSNRVSKVDFNGTVLTGQDIRTKLELKSTDFTWERKGDQIVINTKGYGHGVGMSQYGANGMAQEGKNYVDIAKYYYQGVEVVSSNDLLTKITAQK